MSTQDKSRFDWSRATVRCYLGDLTDEEADLAIRAYHLGAMNVQAAQAQAQSGQWSFHDEAYCVDREAEIEGIFTAGIDIGEWMNRIECHGNSKEAAEELRARIMHAIMSVKE